MPTASPFHSDLILDSRYRIKTLLGQGGCGRTYLAENLNRFNELCVLKEFAPQIKDPQTLKKAAELFQREAKTLYRLSHPQVPEFYELLAVEFNGEEYLLLVEQYIEGPTYDELILKGKPFSETDIIEFLLDLLPVLEYIHAQGVIHRDIAPDNLIQNPAIGKPVLIDFGGVKQIAITAIRQYTRQQPTTRLEKAGYTPEEQKRGQPTPRSDLYALAVTALVLLTGKQPWELCDERDENRADPHRRWHWRRDVSVSRQFEEILDKLLAERERDRYPSATALREALERLAQRSPQGDKLTTWAKTQLVRAKASAASMVSNLSRLKTIVVAPARQQTAPASRQFKVSLPAAFQLKWPAPEVKWFVPHWLQPQTQRVLKALKGLVLLAITGAVFLILGFRFGPALFYWAKSLPHAKKSSQTCQERVMPRLKAMGNSAHSVYAKVDHQFFARHPELNQRSLTSQSEDAQLREEWCKIAEDVLK
jgi:serine/threonine-protein kinase